MKKERVPALSSGQIPCIEALRTRRICDTSMVMDNSLRYPGDWTINEEIRSVLELFTERAKEFRAIGTFQYPMGMTIGVKNGVAFSRANLPDERQLRLSAQSVRHFCLKKSETQFGRVCNLLHCSTEEKRFRDEIARIRKGFSALIDNVVSNPGTGDPDIRTRGELMDAYFNGDYFHSDKKLREFVGAQKEHPWGPLIKQEFAKTLYDVYGCVEALLPVVENALGVDQLAPCPTSKLIQRNLAAEGLGPAPILIQESHNFSTDPPMTGLKCDIDHYLPQQKTGCVVEYALDLMIKRFPGYPEYAVWWRDADGAHRGVVWPAT